MSSSVENKDKESVTEQKADSQAEKIKEKAEEFGGPKGKDPTRYGDWEKNGRCIDF